MRDDAVVCERCGAEMFRMHAVWRCPACRYKNRLLRLVMGRLQSRVRTDSDEFRANRAAMTALVRELAERRAAAREGGGPAARERLHGRGRLTARERIDRLLDAGSPFLELAALAAYGMYEGAAPAAGLVTGIGRVSEREAMILATTPR